MIIALLALIGGAVGLALDALVGRLAAPLEPSEDSGDPDEPDQPILSAAFVAWQSEAGVLALPSTRQVWTRRLLIVVATATLFAIAGARYDGTGHLAIIAAYICVLVVCAATDLLSYRVPNVVTYPAIVGALVIGATMPDVNLANVLVGGLVAGGVLLAPTLVTGGAGMGMGDVKLAAFVGFALGLTNLVPALLLMALLGGGVALFLLATRLRRRGEPIPYAPFISAGALAALLWQGAAFVELS